MHHLYRPFSTLETVSRGDRGKNESREEADRVTRPEQVFGSNPAHRNGTFWFIDSLKQPRRNEHRLKAENFDPAPAKQTNKRHP